MVMKRRWLMILGWAAGIGAATAMPWLPASATYTPATKPSFIGVWNTADPKSQGLQKLVISASGGNLIVDVWAAATRSVAYVGQGKLELYGRDIEDRSPLRGIMTSVWDSGVGTGIFKLDGDRLSVELFTRFTDGSKRANYRSLHTFVRKQPKRVKPGR